MIDTLIVTIVMCIDTCNLSPVQHSIHSAFRELNIKEAVIRAVEDTRQREQTINILIWCQSARHRLSVPCPPSSNRMKCRSYLRTLDSLCPV